MVTKERTIEILKNLGDTADAVAQQLQAEGIKGGTEHDNCPIYYKLSNEFGTTAISVDSHNILLYDEDINISLYENDIPPAVKEFIRKHDQYEYPSVLDTALDSYDEEIWYEDDEDYEEYEDDLMEDYF